MPGSESVPPTVAPDLRRACFVASSNVVQRLLALIAISLRGPVGDPQPGLAAVCEAWAARDGLRGAECFEWSYTSVIDTMRTFGVGARSGSQWEEMAAEFYRGCVG
jgi:hypothetical protein